MAKPNGKYAKVTTEDFDRLLAEVLYNEDICENGAAPRLLAIPGIYEVLSEYYNNEILDAWDAEQAAAAMPDEDEADT